MWSRVDLAEIGDDHRWAISSGNTAGGRRRLGRLKPAQARGRAPGTPRAGGAEGAVGLGDGPRGLARVLRHNDGHVGTSSARRSAHWCAVLVCGGSMRRGRASGLDITRSRHRRSTGVLIRFPQDRSKRSRCEAARRKVARERTPCTLSVRSRAPTKQMGLFQRLLRDLDDSGSNGGEAPATSGSWPATISFSAPATRVDRLERLEHLRQVGDDLHGWRVSTLR